MSYMLCYIIYTYTYTHTHTHKLPTRLPRPNPLPLIVCIWGSVYVSPTPCISQQYPRKKNFRKRGKRKKERCLKIADE